MLDLCVVVFFLYKQYWEIRHSRATTLLYKSIEREHPTIALIRQFAADRRYTCNLPIQVKKQSIFSAPLIFEYAAFVSGMGANWKKNDRQAKN